MRSLGPEALETLRASSTRGTDPRMRDRVSGLLVAAAVWVAFFSAFAAEAYVDWSLRIADGDVHSGGLGRATWFAVHLALGALALVGLAHAARRLRWPLAILVVAAQLAVGSGIYLYACLAYGIGAGIDHL